MRGIVVKEYLRQFMLGRYGADDLSRFMTVAALILMVLSLFVGRSVLYPLAGVLLALCFFRMFSKNTVNRTRENEYYLGLRQKAEHWVTSRANMFKQKKTHCFYKCPSCHTQLRVPKGRGRISITCPKCRTSFEKIT